MNTRPCDSPQPSHIISYLWTRSSLVVGGRPATAGSVSGTRRLATASQPLLALPPSKLPCAQFTALSKSRPISSSSLHSFLPHFKVDTACNSLAPLHLRTCQAQPSLGVQLRGPARGFPSFSWESHKDAVWKASPLARFPL
jgi:hypothetical protein